HHRDPVRERERFVLVVRDVDERHPEALLERAELPPQRLAQLRVEVRERLVEEEDLRLDDERARHGDALLLSARQLIRLPVTKPAGPTKLRRAADLPTNFALLPSLIPKP